MVQIFRWYHIVTLTIMCVLHLRTLEISDWSLIVALQGVMSGIVGGFGNLASSSPLFSNSRLPLGRRFGLLVPCLLLSIFFYSSFRYLDTKITIHCTYSII